MVSWGIGEAVSAAGGSAGLVTHGVAAISSAVVGGAWLRRNKIEALDERWKNVALSAGVAASGLITLDSVYGATWGTLAATIVAEATLGRAWRREHSIPLERIAAPEARARGGWRLLLPRRKASRDDATQVEPERSPVVVVNDEPDNLIADVMRMWRENISRPGGVLPGSELLEPTKRPTGARFIIQTIPGSCQYSDLDGIRGRLAAGLFRQIRDLHPEPYPGNESRAYLTITKQRVLQQTSPYQGPIYRDGVIPVGQLSNGSGEATIVVKDRTGVYPTLITGAPGSGKSTSGLLPISLALKHSGEFLLVHCDGDPEGGSSPEMNELSDARPGAGPEDAYKQLLAIEETLQVRGMNKRLLTEDPLTGLPLPLLDPETQRVASKILPCAQFPGLAWSIDEFYRLSKDQWLRSMGFGERLEQVIRLGRKYGVLVNLATHSVLVGDYFDSTSLRGLLANRNFMVFRNTNKTESDLVGEVQVRPGELPPGGGYFLIASAGGSQLQARGGEVTGVREWAHALPGAQADPDMAEALKPLTVTADFDPIQAVREAKANLAEWRARKQAGVEGKKVEPDGYEQYGEMADLHRLLDPMPELTLIQGGGEEALSITQLKMLAALPGKNAHVAQRVGVSVSYVEKQLPKLVALGLAVQPEKFGPYQRTPAGDKAVTEAAGELDAEADRDLTDVAHDLDQVAN
jgi:hypothetical protein